MNISKFVANLRFRRMLGSPKLRPLDPEERRWRKTLSGEERENLLTWELLTEQRYSMPKAVGHVESFRDSNNQSIARASERAVEEEAFRATERAIEIENEELEIAPTISPLEVLELDAAARLWLKLEKVEDCEDEDLAYIAPLKCTVWTEPPQTGATGTISFTSLSSTLSFPPHDVTLGFWESASQEFKNNFRNRCLAADISILSDTRERFDLQIEDRVFVIMNKYLCWRIDLALDQDRQTLWVRISGLRAEVWSQGSDPNDAEQSKFEAFEGVPPFSYPIPVSRLLPSVNPKEHFKSFEQLWNRTD